MPRKSNLTIVHKYTPLSEQTDEDRRCLARGLAIYRRIPLTGNLVREPEPIPRRINTQNSDSAKSA